MSLSDQDILDLTELISGAIDGRLTEAERARLERRLRESEDARRFYVRMMELSSGLCATANRSEAEAEEEQEEEAEEPTATPLSDHRIGSSLGGLGTRMRWFPRRRPAGWVLAAAAVVLVGGFLGVNHLVRRSRPKPAVAVTTTAAWPDRPDDQAGGPKASGLAILTRAVDVVWEGGGPSPVIGSLLSKGVLRVRSGILQLEFYGGATLVIEGPAEIELKAIDQITCRSGKLRVHVPPRAHGFRVHSPDVDLVDLGTEFGMQVVPGRKSEVHVFGGKVELSERIPRSGRAATWELGQGRGVRFGSRGDITQLDADSPSFLSPLDLERLFLEGSRHRYDQWTTHALSLRDDSRLVTYFSFEGDRHPGSRVLVNQRGDRSMDGAIVGCEWVDGRWPGKGALEFKRPSDRVRIHVPGEFESLTLSAWVRIDAIEKRFNGLMLTDGFEPGEPHWQISGTGQIILGVRFEPESPFQYKDYLSPSVFTPERFGRWTHLATVYDHRAERVTHYVNGATVGSEAILQRQLLSIGDAELGNWGVPRVSAPAPVRNVCGRMDEFALYHEALGPDEVRALYEQGVPGP